MMAAALMLFTALFLAARQKPVWLRGIPVYLSLALLAFVVARFSNLVAHGRINRAFPYWMRSAQAALKTE
jgi:formate hydrogenlyase subunit 4